MSLDILGPASALNSVTTRPAQTTTYGATKTWFKACSSLTAQDGTQLTNDWLNNALAQFRDAYDGMGIVEDNGDDMLLRTILSAGLRTGTDTGTGSALVVTFNPPVTSYTQPLALAVKANNPPAAGATINCNGLGAEPITRAGSALVGGEWVAGQEIILVWDGSAFQMASQLAPTAVYTPKAQIALAAISSLAWTTYSAYGLSLTSSSFLTPTMSSSSFTLPAGTYMFVSRGSITCNAVVNNTNVSWHMRFMQNGNEVGHIHEADNLAASQNLTTYQNLVAIVTAAAGDVFSVQAEIGTTLSADFGGGSASSGTLEIIRIGP